MCLRSLLRPSGTSIARQARSEPTILRWRKESSPRGFLGFVVDDLYYVSCCKRAELHPVSKRGARPGRPRPLPAFTSLSLDDKSFARFREKKGDSSSHWALDAAGQQRPWSYAVADQRWRVIIPGLWQSGGKHSPNPSCASCESDLSCRTCADCCRSLRHRIYLHASGGWNRKSNACFDGLGEYLRQETVSVASGKRLAITTPARPTAARGGMLAAWLPRTCTHIRRGLHNKQAHDHSY